MQRLNNLSQGDSENIHFTATCESVYLRLQRQTLERGEAGVKEKSQQRSAGNKRRKMKMKYNGVCISMVSLGGCVWIFLCVFLLKLFDSAVTVKSSSISSSPFVCFIFIYFHFFIYLARCLNEESTLNP